MKIFTLLSEPTEPKITASSDTKFLPSKEFSSALSAAQLLKKVKQEAIDFQQEVVKECEEQKKRSAEEGFEEGLTRLMGTILTLNQALVKLEEEFKNRILPIAVSAAEKVIGTQLRLDPKTITDIVMNVLRRVSEAHNVTIYVHPKDRRVLEEEKGKIKARLPQLKIFSLQERNDIEPGDCIIETEVGKIDARLETQLKALKKALETFMEKYEATPSPKKTSPKTKKKS